MLFVLSVFCNRAFIGRELTPTGRSVQQTEHSFNWVLMNCTKEEATCSALKCCFVAISKYCFLQFLSWRSVTRLYSTTNALVPDTFSLLPAMPPLIVCSWMMSFTMVSVKLFTKPM